MKNAIFACLIVLMGMVMADSAISNQIRRLMDEAEHDIKFRMM